MSGLDDGSMSLRGWALSRKVPIATAHKAIESGRITRRADGRLDPVKADREWGAASPRGRTSPSRSLIEAQRRLTEHKAARERLRLMQERRALVPVKQASAFLFKAARRCRDRVMQSPARLVVALAPLTDPAAIRAALETEAREVCGFIAEAHAENADRPLARSPRTGNVENDADED